MFSVVSEPSELCRSASKPVAIVVANKPVMVANSPKVVANTDSVVANRSSDRHKDLEARRIYQRDLMRKRRASKQ